MIHRLLLSFIGCLLLASVALAGDKKPDKDKPCPHKPERMEDLITLLPPDNSNDCATRQKDMQKAVVEFYRWYLQNEVKMNTYTDKQKSDLDFVPPFNISWQLLQQYAGFIRKTYPSIDTVRLTSLPAADSGVNGEPAILPSPEAGLTSGIEGRLGGK